MTAINRNRLPGYPAGSLRKQKRYDLRNLLRIAHAAKGKKIEEILELKSIKLTPAARNKRVFLVDTLLMLGYGPRIVEAIDTLATQIHTEANSINDSLSSHSSNSLKNKVSVNKT